jgi:hypothetical protein
VWRAGKSQDDFDFPTHTFFMVYGVSTTQTADEAESMLDVQRRRDWL